MTMFDPEISRGTRIVQIIGGFVVLTILAGIITFLSVGWNNSANDARSYQKQLIKEVNRNDTLQDEYNKLYREYRDATGKTPNAASPDDVKSIPGSTGATGDRGPKGDMGIPGQTGPAGKDSTIPGPQGVAGKDGSSGTPGANGTDGKNGADSTVPGPQGPQGDPGPAGPPGANGNDGRGIQSMSCDGDGPTSSWTIVYTDGSTGSASGPCRVSLLPAP